MAVTSGSPIFATAINTYQCLVPTESVFSRQLSRGSDAMGGRKFNAKHMTESVKLWGGGGGELELGAGNPRVPHPVYENKTAHVFFLCRMLAACLSL